MNKSVKTLALILLVTLSLTACGSKSEPAQDTPAANQPPVESEDTGVITSIKNALTGSATLKCDYTDEDGQVSTVYLKEKMVRIKATESDEGIVTNIEGLIRDNKVYLWSDASSEGWVFDYATLDADENGMTMGDRPIRSSDDVISELEEKGQNCQKESVPGDFFEIPANITWPQQG